MKLYAFTIPTFNVTKPLLTAYELGLELELVRLDPLKGQHKAHDHVARHPLGKVPALEHDGRVLFESMAIVRYLLSLGAHTLSGDDPALTDQWTEYVLNHPADAIGTIFRQEYIRGRLNGLEPDTQAVAQAGKRLDRELPLLEQRLQDAQWLSGSRYGVADIVAGSYAWALATLSYDLTRWPNLSLWYSRVLQRPAFERLVALYKPAQSGAG